MTYRVVHRTEYDYDSRGHVELRRAATCSRATRRARCAARRRCASSPSRTTTANASTSSATASRTSRCSSRTRDSRSPPRAWSTSTGPARCSSRSTRRGRRVRDRLHLDPADDAFDAREFVLRSPKVVVSPDVAEYAAESFPAGRALTEALVELTSRIYNDFTYEPGSTSVRTTLSELLEQRKGVCQDFAHLAVGCLRSVGLAARYVSGYLETVPPPGKPRLVGRGRLARVGFRVRSGRRVGRPRSDEQPVRLRSLRHQCVRSGLRRRVATQRRDLHGEHEATNFTSRSTSHRSTRAR